MTNYSVYPQALDGYASMPLRKDKIHEIVAADHNRLRDAIVKIEQELGVQPSGTYATVRDRLDNIGDAKTAIDAHIADTTDAHDASAISVEDSDDIFHYTNVEKVLEELGLLLPHKPDVIGEDIERVPNNGIPSFVDGYGTKFIYNVSDWSGEATDNEIKRTQTRPINGIRGIHIYEVSEYNNNGIGVLTYDQTTTSLRWQAPGDPQPGDAVDISGLSTGESAIIKSYDTTKSIKIARTSATLPTGPREEYFDIYELNAVSGSYTKAGAGFQDTDFITRTANSSTGVSRHQFMISGIVYPANLGTLVLQRKRRNDDDFYPIAVLDLGTNFSNSLIESEQPVYIPSLQNYDTITLYDRISARRSYKYTSKNVNGENLYENYDIDYYHYQLARYLIPVSNSDIVGGQLQSPASADNFNEQHLKVSAYRLVHYKSGVTDFTGEPSATNIYSVKDAFLDASDGNNTVRFSNLYVDPNPNRPGATNIFLRPQSLTEDTTTTLSGIHYYSGSGDLFDFGVQSNDNLFSNTYLRRGILKFNTNVFNFPNGYTDGYDSYWGASVDLPELFDDGYVLFSATNLPEYDRIARYIVDTTYNNGRQIYPASNKFSVRGRITARFYDPFGPGDGYDAYGYDSRDYMLVNSYGNRATSTVEYFTDETYRIGEQEDFLFYPDSDQFTYSDGFSDDGYVLSEWNSTVPVGPSSLQCGARFTNADADTCGLIYPQDDYRSRMLPLQRHELLADADLLVSYDGYGNGEKWYQRLFSLGYPISNARLRVVSSGGSPVSFEDIAYYNTNRFGKIEVKIPGNDDSDSTEWLDITRLHQTGQYEGADGVSLTFSYGALNGLPTGSEGDFIVPFTFGRRNNANSGNMVAVKVTYFSTNDSGNSVISDSKTRIITMLQLLAPITSES